MIQLSVIIPTRNRAQTLERTLVSLARQTLPTDSFEVVVVDNGSTDATPAVCAGLAPEFRHFTRLYDARPGLHVGRHLGLEHAQADILVYGDDDIEAEPKWLQSIWLAFESSKAALVGGKSLPIFATAPSEWIGRLWAPNVAGERVCGPLSIIDLGDTPRQISPYHVFGCNFAIRKSVILDAGGFHPDGMPEDLICFRGDGETHVSRYIERQGMVAFYHPGASVGHLVSKDRLTVKYFCQRAFNQGISDSFAELREHGRRVGSVKLWVSLLRRSWARLRLPVGPFPSEEIAAAGFRGYLFHRRKYRRDSALRDWVSRKNYFGERGHVLAPGKANNTDSRRR